MYTFPAIRKSDNILNLFLILGVFLFAITNFYEVNRYILWIFIPTGTVLCIISHKSLAFNIYLKFLLAIYIWSTITLFFAIDFELARTSVIRMWAAYGFCVITSHLAKYRKFYNYLHYIYVIFFVACLIYAKEHFLTEEFYLDDNSRMSGKSLNANLFAYLLFFVTISVYYLGLLKNKIIISKIWKIVFILLIPLCFYLSILTASRQIFVIQIPLFIILLWYRYFKNVSVINKITTIVLLVIVLYISTDYVANIYDNSFLKTRNEEIKDDSRINIIEDAINVGLENPFFGVGPDNFKIHTSYNTFAHNSFAELFANSGIVGPVIFLSMILCLILKQYKNFKLFKNKQAFLYMTFGIFYILANCFYVYYLNLWLIGYFIMIATNSLYLNKQIRVLSAD